MDELSVGRTGRTGLMAGFMFLLLSTAAAAQDAELLAAREAIWRAWFANDSTALERLLPEAAAAGSGDAWEAREAIVAGSRTFKANGGRLVRLEFANTTIHRWGDVATITSDFTYETETAGKRSVGSGKATEVFARRRGSWVNPFWHLSGG